MTEASIETCSGCSRNKNKLAMVWVVLSASLLLIASSRADTTCGMHESMSRIVQMMSSEPCAHIHLIGNRD